MANTTRKSSPRTPIYENENGRFTVSSYSFTIDKGQRQGEVVDMVEIRNRVNQWSDAHKAYIDLPRYVNITADAFRDMVNTISERMKSAPASSQ